MKSGNILIITVTIIDLITASLVLSYPYPLVVARLGIFYYLFPQYYIGALLMLFSGMLALIGLAIPSSNRWRFILFIPQQFFLLLTTGSVINFVLVQHYADGVIRSWQFILQDQLPVILLTIGYAFAIFDFNKNKKYY